MKCKWERKKIGDVVDIRRGASPRPIHKFLSNIGMPWVKIADATSDSSRYLSKTNEYIVDDGINKSVKVEPETLIVSNSATPGLPKIMKITACVHDGWLVFSNYRGITRDFLYYKFIDIRLKLVNQANGSVFQNLKTDIVKDFDIYIPTIQTQNKIVDILSKLDDKIELNNKINENLEEQAKAIFKSWFINVDKIPEGWVKASLLDIADYTNGLAMQKYRPLDNEIGIPVLKIKELRQGVCDNNSDLCSPNIKPEYIVNDGDVVFSWSGSLLVDFWCGGKCGLNQHLFKVTSTKYDKWFYYSWTKYHLNKFIAFASAMATTMGHIKREELAKSEVLIPCISDYKNINNMLKPIYNLIITNRIENRNLTKLRDTLLPKLMNGEIDVSDIKV
ncbi:restriction endonuclease subunit S [Anaerofustis stercorihominis]|uniref:restriction endonuclease subunit S n=1 Tax=Anaerofustis stercorihominis TaxID=214853 RepID=UPI00214B96D9|nr:restriction endonuclease subunit S [Anaerofustis stercorihominis]MCR2032777.1 restriction endonuclease subunit S [Anaerofustis stercorihominis]